MSNTKVKSNKTQSFMTQRGKDHTKNAQPKYAYMYTRHNNHKHARQHIAPKNTAHCHCNCMSHFRTHSMTQKSYRKHTPPQNTMHVSYTRKAYHPRVNKFANVECFHYMTKGHTSNVCFYRRLGLNLLPSDYLETN